MCIRDRITTTLIKAKEVRPFAEKLITLARRDSLHSRRLAGRDIQDRGVLKKLFDTLGPRFATRPGGYTRIMKLGARRGDAAEMAILELVELSPEKTEAKQTETKEKAAPKAKKAAPKKEGAEGEAAEEKPKKPAKKAAAPKKEKKEAPAKKAPAKKAAAKKKSK